MPSGLGKANDRSKDLSLGTAIFTAELLSTGSLEPG